MYLIELQTTVCNNKEGKNKKRAKGQNSDLAPNRISPDLVKSSARK
jgi:hypothetical protein